MFHRHYTFIIALAASGFMTTGCEYLDEETVERVIDAVSSEIANGHPGEADGDQPDEEAPLPPIEEPEGEPFPGDEDHDEGRLVHILLEVADVLQVVDVEEDGHAQEK